MECRIICFGIGTLFYSLLKYLPTDNIIALVDNSKQGNEILIGNTNMRIITFTDMLRQYENSSLIVITCQHFYEIKTQLNSAGFYRVCSWLQYIRFIISDSNLTYKILSQLIAEEDIRGMLKLPIDGISCPCCIKKNLSKYAKDSRPLYKSDIESNAVVCFGAGSLLRRIASQQINFKISKLIDSDVSIYGDSFYIGGSLMSIELPEHMLRDCNKDTIIIVTSHYFNEIKDYLNMMGYSRVYSWYSAYHIICPNKRIALGSLRCSEAANLGIRSTHRALSMILKECNIEVIHSPINNTDFRNILVKKYGSNGNNIRYDVIAEYISHLDDYPIRNMLSFMNIADLYIINGEGSMIFSIPARQELSFQYAMIMLAKHRSCKTFYINTILSSGKDNEIDDNKIEETRRFLEYCDELVVRDKLSLNFAMQHKISNINGIKYIPEALFYLLNNYYDLITSINLPNADVLFPFSSEIRQHPYISFDDKYILVSGSSALNSMAASRDIRQRYGELVTSLKAQGHHVVLIKTCLTETYLDDVGQMTETLVISDENNYLMLYWILMNATVFISGRFHPSIIASTGGTPCVVLSSNSHKSAAYYTYFESVYDDIEILPATLTGNAIERILKRTQNYIAAGNQLRERIKQAFTDNARSAWLGYSELLSDK